MNTFTSQSFHVLSTGFCPNQFTISAVILHKTTANFGEDVFVHRFFKTKRAVVLHYSCFSCIFNAVRQ